MNRSEYENARSLNLKGILPIFRNPIFINVVIALLTYAALLLILITVISPHRYDYVVGDIPERPIRASQDIEDEIATLQRIEQARDSVLPVYVLNENVEQEMNLQLVNIFEEIYLIRGLVEERRSQLQALLLQSEETSTEETVPNREIDQAELLNETFLRTLTTHLSVQLSYEELLTAITATDDELSELRDSLGIAIGSVFSLRIKQENLLEAQSTMREHMMRLPHSNELRSLAATIGVMIVRPNMIFDEIATEAERQRVEDRVEPVIYRQNQYIAHAGQPITENQIDMLSRLGLLEEVDIYLVVGISLILLIIYIMVILYLVFFEREVLEQPLLLVMIGILTCIVLVLSYITSTIHPYLMPSALGGMLVTVLLQKRAAIIISIAISILLGIMLDNQFSITLIAMVTGIMGIFMVDKLQSRNSLVWLGLGLSAVTMLLVWSIEIVLDGNWLSALQTSTWGLGSGMLSAVLTMGTLPIWENLFGVITPIRLVEISNPNTPLLKRMLTEAPGTYHHSIIVANLAESAADAIGANGLLARVGAYYHDVGKLKRPHYFKENMMSNENPHDRMNAASSTNIITSHTKEGLDIAKKYRIPRILYDFIEQHHGTSPVKYFYHKAKTSESEIDVKIDSYRHKGPRPKTPEVALVMLADTVEAAVRSMPEPTPAKIEALIRKLLKEKLEDGQLDDCHLTLKNLDTIAYSFTNSLCGVFHERVEYPDIKLKEEESKINDPGY